MPDVTSIDDDTNKNKDQIQGTDEDQNLEDKQEEEQLLNSPILATRYA